MSEPQITMEMIATAEKIIGLSFTEKERQQMLLQLNNRLTQVDNLRQISISNAEPMALQFHPQITNTSPVDVPRSYPLSPQEPVERP